MSKNLALFFDGTWNKRSSETNVYKLYKLTLSTESPLATSGNQAAGASALHDRTSVRQMKFYLPGVGVKFGDWILGGAFGYGISRNIRRGFLWLSEHYEPGDNIFVFGFSRGAYTARSLVGLIRKCGIPKDPREAFAKEAYHIYREKEWEPDGREAVAFKNTFSHTDIKIKFVGVWDTVGALGIPAHRVWFSKDFYRWHDTELSRMVENAYHAMAMDEHRPNFAATVWSNAKQPGPGQSIEQRWFPGSHADVGGGYTDTSLNQIPLRWMQEKARGCGLQFSSDVKVDANAHLSKLHDSFTTFMFGLYALLPGQFPYYRPMGLGVNETIDESVWRRTDSPDGKDEHGNAYLPPALRNRPRLNT
jgi:uncharacterized protein (DUF2235 family)